MTKYVRREPDVVDAYQFTGGEEAGVEFAKLIEQESGSAHVGYIPEKKSPMRQEHIKITDDIGIFYVHEGGWVVFSDYGMFTYENEAFEKLFKEQYIQPTVIWKDIPGHPNWQFGTNGKVRNTFFGGYGRRTKSGHFNLWDGAQKNPWSEKEIGDEDAIKAFFSS